MNNELDEIKLMYIEEGLVVPHNLEDRYRSFIAGHNSTTREIFLKMAMNDLLNVKLYNDNRVCCPLTMSQKDLFHKFDTELQELRKC